MKEQARALQSTFAEGFVFDDHGRRFACSVEQRHRGSGEGWWWFVVSTEPNERHAPFRAEPSDTRDGVRDRVVAFYENMLARRAEPYQRRWGRRDAAAPAQPAAPSES